MPMSYQIGTLRRSTTIRKMDSRMIPGW